MGFLFRVLLLLAMSVSIVTAIPSLESAMQQPEKSDCCLTAKTADEQKDCSKEMPKSKKDQQCCACCASGLAMVLADGGCVEAPKTDPEDLLAFFAVVRPSAERPPVPPPRF